jgi:hypothetical protein
MGAPAPLVVRDRGRSLPLVASWPMMSPMPVLAWLGPLAIVLAVSLVATAAPHVRRKHHVFVLEHRAVTPFGSPGRQRS